MSTPMGVDEKAFRAHIEQGPFQSGMDRGRWHLIGIAWPYAILAVSAANDRGPEEYNFRFECVNYPQTAPTAQPWDVERNVPLDHSQWPGGRIRVPLAFNPGWKGGSCIYLPCDRLSIEGHEPWVTQHPHLIWSPSGDITQYLRIIYELLNSSDYTGTRSS